MARISYDYRVCDRCKEKINERWYKRIDLTRLKGRWLLSGYVHEIDYDLCGKCTEKFDRFMDGTLDDGIPTEYEKYRETRKPND